MSDETPQTISDRPYPFEVKTVLFQLFGLAIATPRDVADIQIDFDGRFTSLEIAVQPGGYAAGNPAAFSERLHFSEGALVEHTVKRLAEIMEKIHKATADGCKIKAQRLKDEAAALLKKAAEIEAHESATTPPL